VRSGNEASRRGDGEGCPAEGGWPHTTGARSTVSASRP
jgi:hypothetical protein